MLNRNVLTLVRAAAGGIWLVGLSVAFLGWSATPALSAFNGCTPSAESGCASNYGAMEDAFCGGGTGSFCTNCVPHPLAFCAPQDPCEEENCRLDNYRAGGSLD